MKSGEIKAEYHPAHGNIKAHTFHTHNTARCRCRCDVSFGFCASSSLVVRAIPLNGMVREGGSSWMATYMFDAVAIFALVYLLKAYQLARNWFRKWNAFYSR